MWWMAAAAGAKVGLSILSGESARATAAANGRISKVNAETGNKTREYKNAATAATNNLARWTQSLNNQRILKAGGEQLEASTQNYLRSVDANSYDDINRSLGDAELLGAQAAQAGAFGATGGVADMVDTSTRIRAGIVDRLAKDQTALASHDQAKRAGMIFSQTVQSLDSSLILDSFDWQQGYSQESTAPSRWANAFPVIAEAGMQLLGGLGGGAPGAAASASPYSLSSATNAKFGFTLPQSTSDGWSLGSARLGSVVESSRAVNPYSLWSK